MPFASFLSGPGDDSYRVPLELFRENRQRLANKLCRFATTAIADVDANANSNSTVNNSLVVRRVDGAVDVDVDVNVQRYMVILKGGPSPTRYDTDHEPIFRQESYFWWLTGVKEPDCSLVMTIDVDVDVGIDVAVDTGETKNNNNSNIDIISRNHNNNAIKNHKYALFVPQLPASYATIMGKIRSLDEWKQLYGVDAGVYYEHQLEDYLEDCITIVKDINSNGDINDDKDINIRILLLNGTNTDSGMMYQEQMQMPVFSESFTSRALSMPRSSAKEREYDKEITASNAEGTTTTIATTTVTKTTTTIVNTTTLFPILADCRVFKSRSEQALIEHVVQITSFAHAYVMRNTRPGMFEYQCESLFKHYVYYNYGSRLLSYTSICGCGPNAAILHYGHAGEPNARRIESGGGGDTKNNDNNSDDISGCLLDMGAEYMCYASDVTCSFPASGRFTAKYRAVYESVLNAQRAVYKLMAPGVSWVECHIAAELEIIKGLHAIGIVRVPTAPVVAVPVAAMALEEDETQKNDNESTAILLLHRKLEHLVRHHRLGAVFMPHGLGHLIGIDTHDVGGYLPGTPPRRSEPGLKSLRTARILAKNMVLTVEPGCYFIDHLLDEAMEESNPLCEYLNKELINREYRGYGGVRLEDVVCVTAPTEVKAASNNYHSSDDSSLPLSCVHNFTLCPRTVSEVEGVMAGGKWPPLVDQAPELRRIKLTTPISPLPPPPSR